MKNLACHIAQSFVAGLKGGGFDFFASVPCGVLRVMLEEVTRHVGDRLWHISALREDIAIGLACGAFLGGKQPVVFMQNSGLGHSINALASLCLPYRVSCLLVIGCRGYPNQDPTEENKVMGQRTVPLLTMLRIPYRELTTDNVGETADWAADKCRTQQCCAAVLVSPDLMRWPS